MSKHWNPKILQGGRRNKRLHGLSEWSGEWDHYESASRWRRLRFGWSEIRLALGGGALLGVAAVFVPRFAFDLPTKPQIEIPYHRFARVIDGDTFEYRGERIRIAGIDAPETHPPRCAYEAAQGERATRRLGQLLTSGPFELRPIDRDEDVYGRKLRNVLRNGESLGAILISEGLARPYGSGRRPWCS